MYALPLLHTEEKKIEIFVSRLRQEIRPFVINAASRGVFADVYNHAFFMEESLKEEDGARNVPRSQREMVNFTLI